jgi:hypothetical protein
MDILTSIIEVLVGGIMNTVNFVWTNFGYIGLVSFFLGFMLCQQLETLKKYALFVAIIIVVLIIVAGLSGSGSNLNLLSGLVSNAVPSPTPIFNGSNVVIPQ